MNSRAQREKDFHNRSFAEHTRDGVSAYYEIARKGFDYYRGILLSQCVNKTVLEYGCGPGSYAFFLARQGASVTGIDISDVAIAQARARAQREQLSIDFAVMDAEDLQFEADSFDVICGTGILHHLDLNRAFGELTRTLRSEGHAVFLEPLGHNPLINLYRRFTPNLRTADEHPLLMRDLRLAREHFGRVDMRFFYLMALASLPVRGMPGFSGLLHLLERVDSALFTILPFLKRYAWIVVLTLSDPRE